MKANVCIVTFPLGEAGITPLSNLVKLFSRLVDRVYVISGGAALKNLKFDVNVQPMRVAHKVSSRILTRIINYMYTQLKILCHVIAISRKVDLFVFSIGGEGLLVPMLALKLLRKKIVLMPGGIATKGYSLKKDSLSKSMSMLVRLNLSLADRLILYSHNLISEGKFTRYQRKTLIAHRHFVDFTVFAMRKKIEERAKVVGYIGRLSEEKGVLNLIKAIPLVLKKAKAVGFIVCGTGALSDEIKNIIKDEGLEAHVKLAGWVPHEDIPRYLNELKLVVLPSFTEGLPNILLESMACGTPVLATPVGAIPDVVVEGKTGFLLKSARPEHIAERVVELLGNPTLLERVSKEAYKHVREKFRYEKTLEIWRNILKELNIHAKE